MHQSTRKVVYAKHHNDPSALIAYRKTVSIARDAKRADVSMGTRMELESFFEQGAVLLAMGDFFSAACTYEKVGSLAASENEILYSIEAWLMASHCHEVNDDFWRSLYAGQLALGAAQKLPVDKRPRSILCNLGRSLIRLVRVIHERDDTIPIKLEFISESDVRRRMKNLLGVNWDKALTGER